LTRRSLLAGTAALVGTALTAADEKPAEPFRYCLNTSTVSGQKLDLVEVIEIAAKAGYQAIEPWIREIEGYVKAGGSLRSLRDRLRDRGLTVESAIGFAEWIVDDDARRKKGLEVARRDMDLVQQIGGTRYAAPPAGATGQANLDLRRAAERYRALLEVGDQLGVVPQVELWGFSRCLSRLGEVLYVAAESGHPKACVLLDVYHLYKGGTPFEMLRLVSGNAMHVLHFNDYPANPPRAAINDAQRVYPGDGVAPLASILRTLRDGGFRGCLSLELFNREYWKQDALTVARTGIEKMQTAGRSAARLP
jgi:sugar phosphate isomerase/epimerase